MGGLTVLAALRKRLPHEDFIYLGDTARLPYGTKSPQTVYRYAEQASQHLLDAGVKALVIACNTASGVALAALKRHYAPLPVFGVVEPGAQAAAQKASHAGVLVLATESTVAAGAYQRALLKERADLIVYARSCPLWVTLAEMGPQPQNLVSAALQHGIRGFQNKPGLTVLLGCTHFPVLRSVLQNELPEADVRIVDSASTTATAVARALDAEGLSKPNGLGEITFLATDDVDRFRRIGAYFLGAPLAAVRAVNL